MSQYPDIFVKLTKDDNAASIVGRVKRALQDGLVAGNKVEEFVQEATAASDLDHLLRIVREWVECE